MGFGSAGEGEADGGQLGFVWGGGGDLEAGEEAAAGPLAVSAEGDEGALPGFIWFVAAADALEDAADGLVGRVADAHAFDDEEGGAGTHHEFAGAGGDGSADGGIDVEASADDGGVADAAGDFEGQAAGGACAGEGAGGVDGEDADGVVGLGFFAEELCGGGLCGGRSGIGGVGVAAVEIVIGGIGFPLFPPVAGFGGEESLFFKAVGGGEFFSALADEELVGGFLHDFSRDGDGVGVVADGGDAGGLFWAEHDAAIEGDLAVGVGSAADADAVDGGIGFDGDAGFFDSVDGFAAAGEERPGGGVGDLAEGPGGEKDRS